MSDSSSVVAAGYIWSLGFLGTSTLCPNTYPRAEIDDVDAYSGFDTIYGVDNRQPIHLPLEFDLRRLLVTTFCGDQVTTMRY